MMTELELGLPSSTPAVRLAGVMSKPASRVKGVVILLSGSGPQDRDQTVAGHRTFAVLRRQLSRCGYAAVSWDDRGVGASDGDYLSSCSAELVDDVLAVLDFVETSLADTEVVLAGHSQGALIAGRVASLVGRRIVGLALLGGGSRPGADVLVDQHRAICRAEGWSEADTEATLALKQDCFAAMAGYPERLTPEEGRDLRRALTSVVGSHGVEGSEVDEIVADLYEWEWRFLLAVNPDSWLREIVVPTLVAIGSRDTQVDAEREIAAADAALNDGLCPRLTTHLLPNLNHLFQMTEGGAPAEYESLGPPFATSLMDPLCDWLGSVSREAKTAQE